ncbi:MAG: cyclic nucleotide-binding domain-containing protein [Deltaproteobacteria bacterium]|nr:cyclic nucleotide-binding domain-containing protein [Deltaproteobacteria bacterium]
MLKNALLLEEVPAVEIAELARLVKTVELGEAQSFVVRGQPNPGLVMVEGGNLEVLLDSSPICSLSPGSLFAEDALVSDAPAPATLRAAAKSKIGLLERKAVARELMRLPFLRQSLETAYRKRVLLARIYTIDLFQALSPEARSKVLDRFEVVDVPGGSVLATEGERGDSFLLIREGEAVLHLPPLSADAPPDTPQTAELKIGDYLGDGALIDDAPHTATVSAPYDVKVMKLTRKNFEQVLKPIPGALDAVRAAFARRSESIL